MDAAIVYITKSWSVVRATLSTTEVLLHACSIARYIVQLYNMHYLLHDYSSTSISFSSFVSFTVSSSLGVGVGTGLARRLWETLWDAECVAECDAE